MDVVAVMWMIVLVISTAAGAGQLEGFLHRNGTSALRARQARLLGYGLAVIFAAVFAAYLVLAVVG